ncbi:hypothetical protein BsWGS_28987 [Bradybaena similaris]
MCDNANEKLVKQEVSDVLCEDTRKRFSNRIDRAACKTIQEMSLQIETEEVIENGASQKDENCHILKNASSPILCLSNEKCVLQNVKTPLKQTPMPAKPVDNIFVFESCYPGRMQTEETPHMSDVSVSNASIDGHSRRSALSRTEHEACNYQDCGVCFSEAGCLEHPERKHAGEKIHKCDVYGAAFARSSSLISHKRKYQGEKPYKCDVCEASFALYGNLTCHKRTHTGEKPYKCDVCEASFAQSGNLTCHKRTHTGEKPYKCDVCGASFADPSSLPRHKRTHTGETPYKCGFCGASFARPYDLKRHKRIHTGVKPYKCDVCLASFTRSDNLKRHKYVHTGQKP